MPYRPPPKESERYRGRRRAPTPPRSRYAAVVTTAFVGAGVVALGAGAGMPDVKRVNTQALSLDPSDLDRTASLDRASRDLNRTGPATSMSVAAPDVWLLPLHDYTVSSPFGMRWGQLHAGTDLAKPEGSPYYAAHAGTVTLARWYGGYGNCVIIDHGNGIETIYGHASKLLVKEGQHVEAGDLLGLVGDTGHSFGPHLHFEVHVNGQPTDAVPFMRQRGVDIPRQVEAIYGGVVTN